MGDLELMRELYRRPGILTPGWQQTYAVVRGGAERIVDRLELTIDERGVIVDALAAMCEAISAHFDALGFTPGGECE